MVCRHIFGYSHKQGGKTQKRILAANPIVTANRPAYIEVPPQEIPLDVS